MMDYEPKSYFLTPKNPTGMQKTQSKNLQGFILFELISPSNKTLGVWETEE